MKRKDKLRVTQWFPGWIKPQHIGVYQRLYSQIEISLCYWDGHRWYADIYPDAKWVSHLQSLPWRGIAR
jgi:hypothetical protein